MNDGSSFRSQHDAPGGSTIESPPNTLLGILRRLGPGLIVAGSIVGSGELIATTKTGAEAGFWLLWLILIGCVIKVFLQVEFGRFSIVNGLSTMDGLNQVPGPTIEATATTRSESPRMRGSWIVWYWFLMWFASIGQLGGIVGGVGQALAISWPLTESQREYNEYVDRRTQLAVRQAERRQLREKTAPSLSQPGPREAVLLDGIAELEQWLAQADQPVIEEYGRRQLAEFAESFDLSQRNSQANAALIDVIGSIRYSELAESGLFTDGGAYDRDILVRELGQAYYQEVFGGKPPAPFDDRWWAAVVAVFTAMLLVVGHYGLIQSFSTFMVCGFTLVTILNLVLLQSNPSWAVSADDIVQGMMFRLPPHSTTALATALATFGIIGVGATEIVAYPYWCIEKGYARFTGPRDKSPEWADRARGWMRVMRWDAWISMVVYTFATIAFYLLGAAILGRSGLIPQKSEMIRTLAVMYEPVFGESARLLFLVGAFAVLYSTYFVANAAHARVFSDALGVLGAASRGERAHGRRVMLLSGLFPLLCLVMYVLFPNPAQLVLISGVMQALMLPMLAFAGLYFRYYRNDPALMPGRLWDAFLWLSAVGMSIAGIWALISQLS